MPGGSPHPRPHVQMKKTHELSHHRYAETIRHSLRDGFNGFLRSLPGDRALLPPSPAMMRWASSACLIPASGYQNATTSPSARHAFVLRTTSVHRIPRPTFVTTAKRPSWRARDGRISASDLPDVTSEMACDTLARRANHLASAKTCQGGRHSGARVQRASPESMAPQDYQERWNFGPAPTRSAGANRGFTIPS